MQQLAGIINESSDLTADQIALNYSNTSPNTPPGATPGETPLKNKIKEMILAELGLDINNTTDAYDPTEGIDVDLEEAKKDEEVEDVETTDTTEEAPAEDAPAEETPATGGGLEDIAADMEGTEGDLMDYLMKALKVAKGMNNEKLETQIGNTLKFFVSEYIGGEEQ